MNDNKNAFKEMFQTPPFRVALSLSALSIVLYAISGILPGPIATKTMPELWQPPTLKAALVGASLAALCLGCAFGVMLRSTWDFLMEGIHYLPFSRLP